MTPNKRGTMSTVERLPPLVLPITPESASNWLHEARRLSRQLQMHAALPGVEERWLAFLQTLEALRDAHDQLAAMSQQLRETSEILRSRGGSARTRAWPRSAQADSLSAPPMSSGHQSTSDPHVPSLPAPNPKRSERSD
ncbi:MAG: hypothetical protein ABJD11_10875 [Gemmatimonadota bacterium]